MQEKTKMHRSDTKKFCQRKLQLTPITWIRSNVRRQRLQREKVERPSWEAIEMSPELVFETGQLGLGDIRVLEATKNLIVDVNFEFLVSGESGRKTQGYATSTLGVFLGHDQL